MSNKIEVVCLTSTKDIIGTVWKIWASSRNIKDGVSFNQEREFLRRALLEDLPLTEHIYFTFLLKNIPIALREQLVRHKIATHYGDNYGVDTYLEDKTQETFWSQSMRVFNMGEFARNESYHITEEMEGNKDAVALVKKQMQDIEDTYNKLIQKYGMSEENARMIIPLAATHDMVWTISLKAMTQIVRKRCCWIMQIGLWKEILLAIRLELAVATQADIDFLFRPSCFESGVCPLILDNQARLADKDPLPVCPKFQKMYPEMDKVQSDKKIAAQKKLYEDFYKRIWGEQ